MSVQQFIQEKVYVGELEWKARVHKNIYNSYAGTDDVSQLLRLGIVPAWRPF